MAKQDRQQPSRRVPWWIALAGGLSLGAAVGTAAVGPMLASQVEPAAVGGAVRAGQTGAGMHVVEDLVLNPAGSKGARFLILSLALEVDAPTTADELRRRDAELRDTVMHVLGRRTVPELSDVGARAGLKEELRVAAEGMLEQGRILRIYLPQFVIQ